MSGWTATAVALSGLLSLAPCMVAAQPVQDSPLAEERDSAELAAASIVPGYKLYFVKGRGYGTDVYAGPLDMIFNKGFAVAQWQDQDRHIFSYPYGWHAVWASVTKPGVAMERAGGWGTVLRAHVLPLSWAEVKEGQWTPNYFGHVLEGGLSYRRLLEWNRVTGVPFPTLTAVLVTQLAVTINEAYETPVNDPWVQEHGTAGAFVDWVIMDPLGMLLFHQDGIAGFFANKLGAMIWPRQASITFPGGRLTNNGQSVVIRPKLWFSDDFRVFFRGGVGAEAGISIGQVGGLAYSFGLGVDSSGRKLNIEHIEEASFAFSTGFWIDRGGALLFGATYNHKTDRRISVDVFPGVISVAGATLGTWFQFDQDWRPYIGITGKRTMGGGIGVGF